MNIVSITAHPRIANAYIAKVTGMATSAFTVYTELNGNRVCAHTATGNYGPGATRRFTMDRNAKMLNAFTAALEAA